KSTVEDMVWKGWSTSHSSPAAYSMMTAVLGMTGNMMPKSAPMLKEWTSVRAKPKFAKKSLHRMVKKLGVDDE
ncbi:MAG: DUF3390 domain-containing protein, partial [Alphaproteobacteria bacterium]|nr:DUF3390 domain-containing protein [Alphaproteobacteria bacterium]